MIKEHEDVARLKARLDQWQAYNTRSQTVAAPLIVHENKELSNEADENALISPKLLLPVTSEPFPVIVEDTKPVSEVAMHQEAHIADLQAAVEHERAQNQELTQTVRRAQALHFVTLQSESRDFTPVVSEAPMPVYSHTLPAEPPVRPVRVNGNFNTPYLVGVCVLLSIALGLVGFVFYY